MFSLENSITQWKQSLNKKRFLEDGDILEVEMHLREKIQDLVVCGLSEEQAFSKAIVDFDINSIIDSEYEMARTSEKGFSLTRLVSTVMSPLMVGYFKTGLRQIKRQSTHSIINMMGLAIGIASIIIISLWIHDELNFNAFHKNIDRLQLVTFEDESPVTPYGLTPALRNDFPDIEQVTRFVDNDEALMTYKGKSFFENGGVYVDDCFFDMFSFEFIERVPDTLFENPYSIVLTETIAEKLFPDESPLGKTITLDNKTDVIITGVIRDVPLQSSYTFRYVRPVKVQKDAGVDLNDWKANTLRTFVLLKKQVNPDSVIAKISDLAIEHVENETDHLSLWPFKKIHLSQFDEISLNTPVYVYMFSGVALFILLIVLINFVNLTTASSAMRKKEIGIRKVLGAERQALIVQFLGETLLMVVISSCFALLLVEVILPAFNQLTEKNLIIQYSNPGVYLAFLLLILGITVLAGFFPAFFMSALEPSSILRSRNRQVFSKLSSRSILAVVQFTLAVILITSTFVIQRQVTFMTDKDTGIAKHFIITAFPTKAIREKRDSFRQQLLSHSSVENLTFTSTDPVERACTFGNTSVDYEGKNENIDINLNFMSVDHNFGDTFNVKMVEGRFFSPQFKSDTGGAIVLNETAVKELGMDSPIGKSMTIYGTTGRVIGIMKDFHFLSLHHNIEPLAMQVLPWWHPVMCIRLKKGFDQETLAHIENTWKTFEKNIPFSYNFMDKKLESQYNSEKKVSILIRYLSVLAIFISCIGLFGLTSHTAQQRTKEISIRKIIGADNISIFRLLSGGFVKWVVLANVIALPISYVGLTQWLNNFAYQSRFGINEFMMTALITLGVTFITISYHCIKTININPVETLRDE